MIALFRNLPSIEAALLRRSMMSLSHGCRRCGRCRRSPLIGERVYVYESGSTICELCRALERSEPVASEIVHGPSFGQSIRVVDRRNAPIRAA